MNFNKITDPMWLLYRGPIRVQIVNYRPLDNPVSNLYNRLLGQRLTEKIRTLVGRGKSEKSTNPGNVLALTTRPCDDLRFLEGISND